MKSIAAWEHFDMAREVFIRNDGKKGSDTPFVSVDCEHFRFNAIFARLAELSNKIAVTIHLDAENLKIGFEFHLEKHTDSFSLFRKTGGRGGARCSSGGLVQKHPWIRSVANLAKPDRRFIPCKEGKLWVIQLCPAFEERRARESVDIPSDARGIYRYLREDGEIVYIGRGEIKKRLSQPERKDWDFDRVEYSLVADPDQQVKWEDYWITRFKETNKGRLPFYNKISGASREAQSEVENERKNSD